MVKELSTKDRLTLRKALRSREDAMKEWTESPHRFQQKYGKDEIKKVKQVRKKLGMI